MDELLTNKPKPETVLVPEEKRKHLDDMMFKIIVNSTDGDKVRINLPMPLVRMGLELGMKLPQVSGNTALGDALSVIDIPQILAMVEKGVIGKLIEVESKKGDVVEISVE